MKHIGVHVVLAAVAATAVFPATAGAHIEREPIFVDPAADESIFPPAGGAFVSTRSPATPEANMGRFERSAARRWREGVSDADRAAIRDRYVALSREQQEDARSYLAGLPGDTIAADLGLTDPKVQAQETIVVCRPDSMDRLRAAIGQFRGTAEGRELLPVSEARQLIRDNDAYRELCRFDEIHPAVMAADNQDSVLIMPGFYTEPTARSKPHNDPACAEFVSPENGAPTYAYHFNCPNDLSLVTLLGEDLEGNCVRCNVQIHGTGVRAEDVILEGGESVPDPGVSGDLFEEGLGPAEGAKEVGIRVERADGAYVHNLTVRNVEEHGIYSIETDGMAVNDANMFYAREYGHLSFVTDHNMIKNSETAGSDDGGIYPGASPPSRPRINTIVKDNLSHHNALGFSGTMGSNILIKDNRFVNNSVGISLDSFYRAGHPGFPQNSSVITNNVIAHNNFDTFGEDAWVKSSVPAAVGTGAWLVGGNDNIYKNNHVYDNWRNGFMLITVPDALSNQFSHAPELPEDARISTSHRNRYEGNVMGRSPEGEVMPNGTDFWWDELGQGNCWDANTGLGGGATTSDPARLPGCDDFPNVGLGNPLKEIVLVACGFALTERDENTPACDWYQQPPEPARPIEEG
ncbi:MAG: right-handed parallel beta-helix repeat-containing protein [Thermoleophilaceae bacterium]